MQSIFEWLADQVDAELISKGSVVNDPSVAAGADGKTYNRLSFTFGKSRDYSVYLDHKLNEFKEGDGGTLGVGYESPIPYVGSIGVRAAQNLDSVGKGTFDWYLNMNDEAWRLEE